MTTTSTTASYLSVPCLLEYPTAPYLCQPFQPTANGWEKGKGQAVMRVVVRCWSWTCTCYRKETAALRLKTDSFVVESNVHSPTDYGLLWDSARKCIETVCIFLGKYNNLPGWRKIKSWKAELKGLMRELGKATASGGKGKEQREAKAARSYINKATALYAKLDKELPQLPIVDDRDLALVISLEYFMQLLLKHIDLVTRRIINGETIPHEGKMFSIFETYTEIGRAHV